MHDIFLFIQHHWALSVALAVILALLILLEFIKIKRGTNRLSPSRVVQLINHQNAAIVDVRSTDNFAQGHIIGAVSLPLQELEEKSKKLEKFKTQPIVLVCAAGLESQRAAVSLKKQGFDVFILAGGIRAWREADMPLVKT